MLVKECAKRPMPQIPATRIEFTSMHIVCTACFPNAMVSHSSVAQLCSYASRSSLGQAMAYALTNARC